MLWDRCLLLRVLNLVVVLKNVIFGFSATFLSCINSALCSLLQRLFYFFQAAFACTSYSFLSVFEFDLLLL